jgi:hypothetical protein
MVLHFAFLVYLVLGGFLAWRWRRTIWLHVAVVAWGVSIVTIGQECPLTHVENWARRRAGGQDLPGGFINTYLTGVVYPPAYLAEVRLLVAALVLVSWVGWWHRSTRRATPVG